MSIQKKSLITTLKSAKKANVVREDVTVSGAIASPTRVAAPAMKLSQKRAAAMKLSQKRAAAMKLSQKRAAAMKLSQKHTAAAKF
jgi:hypothetical protein